MNISGHASRLVKKGLDAGALAKAAQTAIDARTSTFEHAGLNFAVGVNDMNRASYGVDLLDSGGGRMRMLDLVPDPPAWPHVTKSVLPESLVDPTAYLPTK